MGIQDTPAANRLHIGFFGKRNAGKSSVLNSLTGQDMAIVSPVLGTTTDPVYKAMELLPLGPVMLVDTPGYDDTGALGSLRVEKTRQVLRKTDLVLLVAEAGKPLSREDSAFLDEVKKRGLPCLVVYNKADLVDTIITPEPEGVLVSARNKQGFDILKEKIGSLLKTEEEKLRLVGDLLSPSDFVVLVTPIDKAAPKGRLILPQQQTIRDILEADATAIVVKEHELRETLMHLGKKPRMVITDSQVFAKAAADTPPDVLLTSFSILFARYKGFLETGVRGALALDALSDGARILMGEGCTHHRQCDDIGTVKLPRWIRQYTGKDFEFTFSSGGGFPEDLSGYDMVVHCGGCMLHEKEMHFRQNCALDQGVPFTNYGLLIAYMQGILKRALAVFPGIYALYEETAYGK